LIHFTVITISLFNASAEMAFINSTSTRLIVEMSSSEIHRERMHSLVCKELGSFIQEADISWLESLFCNISKPSEIEKYLHGHHEYRHGRWTKIPEAPKAVSELHAPLCQVINSITQHLVPAGPSSTREFTISQLEEEATPDLVIRATGPSFSTPTPSSTGFSNVAACISVRLDSESDEIWRHLAQLKDWAKYAESLSIQSGSYSWFLCCLQEYLYRAT
jgi:hypothetical protein